MTKYQAKKVVFKDNEGNYIVPVIDPSDRGSTSDASLVPYHNSTYPTVEAALDKLLYVPLTGTFTGGSNNEIGSTISSVVLNWSYNKNVTEQSLSNSIGVLDSALRTYTYSAPITSNTTFTLSATDGTTPITKSTSVTFMNKRYWGAFANNTITDEEILGLSQELSTSRAQSRVFDCTGGKYFYFVIREDYCSRITFNVGGLSFSDIAVETRSITNASGHTDNYKIYRCNNLQTGSAINVVVS